MTTKHDERTRNLIEALERAMAMARDGEHGEVETLLEAALEAILIGPSQEDADIPPFRTRSAVGNG